MAHTYVHIWIIPYGGHLLKPKHFCFHLWDSREKQKKNQHISWIWISNVFWRITVGKWIRHIQLIRSHQSTEAPRVYSCCIITYIQFQYPLSRVLVPLPKMLRCFISEHLWHIDCIFMAIVDKVLQKLLHTHACFTCYIISLMMENFYPCPACARLHSVTSPSPIT